MGIVLLTLLPLIIGASILPMWCVISLLLIRSENGLAKSAAFSLGGMIARGLQALLFSYVAREATDEPTTKGLITAIFLMLLGIVLWIAAAIRFCREDTGMGLPPKWLGRLNKVSPIHAFGVGAVLMLFSIKPLVFTLSAVATIDEANLNPLSRVIAFVAFVIGAQLLVLSPVIVSIAAPKHATRFLDGAQRSLERNNKVITVVLSIIFGSWFFYKGASDLFHRAYTPRPAGLTATSGACHGVS